MAKADWTITGAGTYSSSVDTPSDSGFSFAFITSPLLLVYNGKTNIINPEMVWWSRISGYGSYGAIIVRSQSTINTNNCYYLGFTTDNILKLYKIVGGVTTLLGSVGATYTALWKQFRLRFKNYDYTIEWNTGTYLSPIWAVLMYGSDSTHQWAIGASGFYSSGVNGYVRFDDIDVGEEIP